MWINYLSFSENRKQSCSQMSFVHATCVLNIGTINVRNQGRISLLLKKTKDRITDTNFSHGRIRYLALKHSHCQHKSVSHSAEVYQ